MRAGHGKLRVKGPPRMTRPRVRKNMVGVSVVDPGGNGGPGSRGRHSLGVAAVADYLAELRES
jgi:hypothetical protein